MTIDQILQTMYAGMLPEAEMARLRVIANKGRTPARVMCLGCGALTAEGDMMSSDRSGEMCGTCYDWRYRDRS